MDGKNQNNQEGESAVINRGGPEKTEPTQHIDRTELFKEHGSVTPKLSGSSSDIGRKHSSEPGHLEFDDPYASAGVTGLASVSRGLGRADKDKLSRAKEDSQTEAYLDKWLKENPPSQVKEQEFTILDKDKKLDPRKPTVLFLDEFSDRFKFSGAKGISTVEAEKEVQLNDPLFRSGYDPKLASRFDIKEQRGLTHGDISARFAEQNGFNVIRGDDSHPDRANTDTRFSKLLNEVSDKIESGELKLGKGDVVNLSEGRPDDPDFEQATKRLGLEKNPLTAENYKDRKEEILNRLKSIASEPENPNNAWAKDALDTNLAIQRLQAKGIEVVHAAGNEKGKFSIDFMAAEHQLASVDPRTGRADQFSAVHSNTKAADGVLPIRFDPGPELGPGRGGRYSVDGTNLSIPGEEFGNLNQKQTISLGHEELQVDQFKKNYASLVGREAPPLNNEKGHIVAVAAGTSFSNVHFLAEQRERLRAKKLAD